MPKPIIALITARAALNLDDDLAPLKKALLAAGAMVSIVAWDDTSVNWEKYDLALLRSTWDYTERLAEFLSWADHVATATVLMNPLEIVRWNIDKHYLLALAKAGIPIVPSLFLEPGDNPAKLPGHEEFVVKPAIGAGSRDAQRYIQAEHDAAMKHAQHLLGGGRSTLIQPYLHSVDEQGESALIFFNGQFSHAIRKGPLLHRGESPTEALFAAERITSREPSADEMAVAARTLAAIPSAQPLLYARIDLIRDAEGSPCVLELELTEPSLFFDYGVDSANRFAAAILQRLETSCVSPAIAALS